MQNETSWKRFYRFAAFFNFAAAFMLLFATEAFFTLLQMQSLYVPELLPWAHQFGVLVLVFGFGYWRIAGNPKDHKDIIWMGCIGKTLVFIAAWVDTLSFPALMPFAIFVIADLAFAVFYGLYLLNHARYEGQRQLR
ncbi:hypothetical protein [Spongiibacter sp. UBA1325]|jgi:hypothetical protein|uniref:hypothetical protein n=1 Tax=Spongiibacter sp. UBA1325 TaxID=1947543 RepID=UPI00257A0EBE|nr:hypothetical protein [Spongiibacter sp. UBA1325]|tara:strand:+ start:23423 stop:23833 length:411 start_codon:yes stop_codon:yes gene_type:complete